VLCITTKINELLVSKSEDKALIVRLILTIHQALKMLDKTDNHRTQAVLNLKETVKYV
jgi:hypothetical protein